jgi:threonine/homoserine/homoserine lactone efflux protein
MPLTEYTALLLLGLAVSFTPGPNTALSATMGAQGGLRHALPFVVSVPFGWGLLLTLSVLGVSAVLAQAETARLGVALAGTGYLLWLAKRLATAPAMPADALDQDNHVRIGFVNGVALQFVNIKAWMLSLSIVAGWLTGPAATAERFAVVLPTMMAFAFFSNLLYAWVGASLRQWLRQGRRLKTFNQTMASVLCLTALWMLKPFL